MASRPITIASPLTLNRPEIQRTALVLILLLATVLRLWDLTRAPPGLNQDEASNAWNAHCLLKTGRDEHGAAWPIFYLRALGENRTPLLVYLMIPFQAIGGVGVVTTRLPNALAGVATVALLAQLGRRWFGGPAGLLAALFLALCPWHVQISRLGFEASLVPFLVTLAIATASFADVPPFGAARGAGSVQPGRSWPAPLLAGWLAGLATYGYWSVRLFLPVFLVASFILTRPWRRAGRAAATPIVAFGLGFAMLFGPLAFQHWSGHDAIGERGRNLWVWRPTDSAAQRAALVAHRYAAHFGPRFLFLDGDPIKMQSPPGGGEFSWYVLPGLLAGLVLCGCRWRSSTPHRLLALWVVLYPIADILFFAPGPHALRSTPGVSGICLMAAVGSMALLRRAERAFRNPRMAVAILGAWMLVEAGVCFSQYYVRFDRDPDVRAAYQAGFVNACRWLRPRAGQADEIVIQSDRLVMPYPVAAVLLGHDPRRWQRETRIRVPRLDLSDPERPKSWDDCIRFGKVRLVPADQLEQVVHEIRNDGRTRRMLLITRLEFRDAFGEPATVIRDVGIRAAFLAYDWTWGRDVDNAR